MKQAHLFVILGLVLTIGICNLFNRTYVSGISTDEFPAMPDVFSSPASAPRSLSPAGDNPSDGVYYGYFQPLYQIGTIHNNALATMEEHLLEYATM